MTKQVKDGGLPKQLNAAACFPGGCGKKRMSLARCIFGRMAILAVLAAVSACSDGGGSSVPLSNTAAPAAAVNLQETFIDGLRDITPNLETAGVSEWSYWRGDMDHRVFKKLFHPDSGMESVYGPLDITESALAMVEDCADLLDTPGEYEETMGEEEDEETAEDSDDPLDAPEEDEGTEVGGTYTIIVEELENGILVPFFNVNEDSVTKKVIITSYDNSMNYMVAYDMEGSEKVMVCHVKRVMSDTETEYVVFRAHYNEDSGDLEIWTAAVADKDDSFKLQYHWKGNMDEESFALTQMTNAAKKEGGSDGFWKVMGGGNIDGQMAFRANTNDAPAEDYFVVTTMEEMTGATAPAGYPADAATIDSATLAVQGYVDPDNANCLGWVESFPEYTELIWDYVY